MCGIAGEVQLRRRHCDVAGVEGMSAAVAHRGPDGSGTHIFADGHCVLAHRRLAVIDVSDAGAQPMLTSDGAVGVTYNGEIYNYLELKDELRQRGFHFRSTCDTEVLLAAYEIYGMSFVERLRGMFAFALYDQRRRRLVLARDRLGIKPLYVHVGENRVAFCSEPDPLREYLDIDALDPGAVASYFRNRFVAGTASIWRGIERLPPGEVWSIDIGSGRCQKKVYWDICATAANRASTVASPSALEELWERLRECVDLHARSDVPLGIFLSGGLDSSSVLCALREALPQQCLQSFSLGFGTSCSELPLARRVAAHCGSTHREDNVVQTTLPETLDLLAAVYGEPLADSSAVPLLRLSELAAEHVKVVLAGDGGDELFFGYKWYKAALLLQKLWPFGLMPVVLRALLAWALPPRWETMLVAAGRRGQDLLDVVRGSPFDEAEVSALTGVDEIGRAPGFCPEVPEPLRSQVYDLRSFTVDSILAKVDRASMYYGLEARVPLLDHAFVEHSFGLPAPVDFLDGGTKPHLRKALRGRVPHEILTAPKRGFGLPLRQWADELHRCCAERLTDGVAVQSGWLDGDQVKRFLARPAARTARQLWTLLVFEVWLSHRLGHAGRRRHRRAEELRVGSLSIG